MSHLITRMEQIVDHQKTGTEMRAFREKNNVSLRAVSRAMKVSAPYLSDLELGRRKWSEEKAAEFVRAISSATTKQK